MVPLWIYHRCYPCVLYTSGCMVTAMAMAIPSEQTSRFYVPTLACTMHAVACMHHAGSRDPAGSRSSPALTSREEPSKRCTFSDGDARVTSGRGSVQRGRRPSPLLPTLARGTELLGDVRVDHLPATTVKVATWMENLARRKAPLRCNKAAASLQSCFPATGLWHPATHS